MVLILNDHSHRWQRHRIAQILRLRSEFENFLVWKSTKINLPDVSADDVHIFAVECISTTAGIRDGVSNIKHKHDRGLLCAISSVLDTLLRHKGIGRYMRDTSRTTLARSRRGQSKKGC